ncbi:MAG TPA: HAMP domain-containing protein, partial [Anaerolineales bacterium]
MTRVQKTQQPRRKKSLRRRMVVSLTGLVVLPLAAAMVLLFFVVRDDVGKIRGHQLAQEAGQLAERLQTELHRYQQGAVGLGDLQQSLELHQRGTVGEVVLFTAGRQRLAGNLKIPIPPTKERGTGWISFEADGESYFAGVTAVKPFGSAVTRDWFLAVVQPTSQVYAHFHYVSSKVAFLLATFGILFVTLAWRMANQFLRPILEIRRGAEIISRINLHHRIELDSGDELEELAVEINLM